VEFNITRRRFIAALLCASLPLAVRAGAGQPVASTRWLTATMNSLASRIEALAARTMPANWELLHACLYYALAGQYLLAQRGLVTRLEGGVVVYNPYSPASHDIKPHVWLETDTHFIDGSTLARWGYITVIPRQRVARRPGEVIPGFTRVLILEQRSDPEFLNYIATHRARFERTLQGVESGHE
jgi:hypothetical protein